MAAAASFKQSSSAETSACTTRVSAPDAWQRAAVSCASFSLRV